MEDEWSALDRATIAEWRRLGYVIPAPELTGERLDNFIRGEW